MKLNIFNNPQNILGNLAAFSLPKQVVVFASILLLLLFLPVQTFWQKQQTLAQSTAEIQELSRQKEHNQRLLQSLQRNNLTTSISSLSQQLPTINEQINQLAQGMVQIQSSQWELSSRPKLALQMDGHFSDFYAFLTALVAQQQNLKLLDLTFTKTEQSTEFSLQGELLLQLYEATK